MKNPINERILDEVLSRVRPSEDEKKRVERVVQHTIKKINEIATEMGVRCTPLLVGSVAKGTWLRNPDIDIFMMFPVDVSREDLERTGLEIGKRVAPAWEERYAEHPYVHTKIDDLEMDIVPCYEVKSPDQKMSAVDRTPWHTEFVRKNLKPEQRDEVLLLKQFMKGIGVYGAEAKVEGFSGYVTELLIIKYGCFTGVLDAGARWRRRVRLSIEPCPREVFSKFDAPMVFIDPVDSTRNVTAALSLESLATFIHASREASKNMKLEFFFPRAREKPDPVKIREGALSRGTHIFGIRMKRPDIVDDILYPQVKKCLLTIQTAIQREGAEVLRIKHFCKPGWILILIEVDRERLSNVFPHPGPPVWHENAETFLKKWRDQGYHPFIRGDRWMVIVKRGFTTPEGVAIHALRTLPIGKDLEKIAPSGEVIPWDDPSIIDELSEFIDHRMPWER